jgi:hypothetical protein
MSDLREEKKSAKINFLTLSHKAIYLESKLLIMFCSYFLIRSSFSSHAPFAGSFPTATKSQNINEI